jgi:hypothetical protein
MRRHRWWRRWEANSGGEVQNALSHFGRGLACEGAARASTSPSPNPLTRGEGFKGLRRPFDHVGDVLV